MFIDALFFRRKEAHMGMGFFMYLRKFLPLGNSSSEKIV